MDVRPVKDLRRGGGAGRSHRHGGHSRRGSGHRGSREGRLAAAEVDSSSGLDGHAGGSDEDEKERPSYRCRQVHSNWSRYGDNSELALPSDGAAQSSGGDDFKDVLQRAGTAASHMKLDDVESGAFVDAASADGSGLPAESLGSRLRGIDLTALLDGVQRLPFGVRLLLDDEAEDYLRARACRGDVSVATARQRLWRIAAAPTSAALDDASARLARPPAADSASRAAAIAGQAVPAAVAAVAGKASEMLAAVGSGGGRSAGGFRRPAGGAAAASDRITSGAPAVAAASGAKPSGPTSGTDSNGDVHSRAVPAQPAVPQPAASCTAAVPLAAAARAAGSDGTASAVVSARVPPIAAAAAAVIVSAASRTLEDELDELLAL